MKEEEYKLRQRKAFEEYCRLYASPGAENSLWYWLLWQAGADHALNNLADNVAEVVDRAGATS